MNEAPKPNPFEVEKVDKWLDTISGMNPYAVVFVDTFKRATEKNAHAREVDSLSYSKSNGSRFSIQGVLNEAPGTFNLRLILEEEQINLRVSFGQAGLSVTCNSTGDVIVNLAGASQHVVGKEEAAFYGLVSEVHKGVSEIGEVNRSDGHEIPA